jgi:hypothetical protein
MSKYFELLDWVTAEKFCELTGEQITNLKNLRPHWEEGKVWVKVSDRQFYIFERLSRMGRTSSSGLPKGTRQDREKYA